MSQSAVLGDAIDHIVETKTKVKSLQEELEELERDGCKSKLSASNETAPAPVAGNLDTSSSHGKFRQVGALKSRQSLDSHLSVIRC